jgi:FkbM family methyltransferase
MKSEPWLANWWQEIIAGQCRTALDIGANAGEWSQLLSAQFQTVVAVEPDERQHVDAADTCPNVIVERAAVYSHSGAGTLRQRTSTLQSSVADAHPIGDAGRNVDVVCISRVQFVTMDDLLAKYPTVDFVKLDIEGGEVEALRGARLQHWAGVRWLIESHNMTDAVCLELARIGFKAVDIIRHPSPDAAPGHEWIWAR